MKRAGIYFLIELKRAGKLMLFSLLIIIIVSAAVTGGVYAVNNALNQQFNLPGIDVGIYVPESEKMTGSLISLASNMDSIRSICNLEKMSEAECMEKLETGTIQAAIIIPPKFIHNIMVGINTPVTVYLPSNSGVSEETFKQLLVSSESLLQTAEGVIYSVDGLQARYHFVDSQGNVEDTISYAYLNEVLNRNSVFESENLSVTDGFTAEQYYFSMFAVIIILLGGISLAALYGKADFSVGRKLTLLISPWKVAAIKIIVSGIMFFFMFAFIYTLACVFSPILNFDFLVTDIAVYFKVIPLMLLMAAFTNMFFASGTQKVMIPYVAVVSVLFLITGGIVPVYYLPKAISRLNVINPLNCFTDSAMNVMWGDINIANLLAVVIWLALFYAATVLIFNRNVVKSS